MKEICLKCVLHKNRKEFWFNIYYYSSGYFSQAARMKYLSVFSGSSNLLPIFNKLKPRIVSYVRDWSFQDLKTWITCFSASPIHGKTRQKKILFWEEREKNTCHQLLKHITQFPAEKSCQYFKWQFLLYKLLLLKFQNWKYAPWPSECETVPIKHAWHKSNTLKPKSFKLKFRY